MIEDGLPLLDIPGLRLVALQDLGPAVVIIPLPLNEGTQDLLHLRTNGTVEKSHTQGIVERGHIHGLRHPWMVQGAVAKVRSGTKLQSGTKVEAVAELLILKIILGNQLATGLPVSELYAVNRLTPCTLITIFISDLH